MESSWKLSKLGRLDSDMCPRQSADKGEMTTEEKQEEV